MVEPTLPIGEYNASPLSKSGRIAAAWLDSVEPGALDPHRPLHGIETLQVTPRVASTRTGYRVPNRTANPSITRIGTTAALMRGTWVDYVVRIITIGGLSIPSFWFGMLIMITLLYLFNWLPPITFTPIYVDPVANKIYTANSGSASTRRTARSSRTAAAASSNRSRVRRAPRLRPSSCRNATPP